ncbi:MAG: hypothetical protein RIB93_23275 [Coleofasciculus sp. D1-CHI-01]|uniref:hypothetical protein n=1 Tax=Coleofasciculus sp. D1-CHI-01 TaxID=3068482 RepID=UPI0032F908CB
MMFIDVVSNPTADIEFNSLQRDNQVINNVGRFFLGKRLCKRKARTIQSQSHQSSIFQNLEVNETIHSLNQQGIYQNLNLPEPIIKEIHDLALATPCHDPNNTQFSFHVSEKEQVMMETGKPLDRGIYTNSTLSCSTIKQLETDPILLAIAAKHLNAEPIHQDTQLWWSFAVESTLYERRQESQRFFRDIKNPRSLTFYFYLTDVDLCSNPHVCVLGSHRRKKLTSRFLRQDHSIREISQHYGYANITSICGKAGLGFVQDARCFHKKNSPSSSDRLTLELKFTAKPRSI